MFQNELKKQKIK